MSEHSTTESGKKGAPVTPAAENLVSSTDISDSVVPVSTEKAKSSEAARRGVCRVWIVEDHWSISQMLEALLETMPGFVLAGASADGGPALEAAREGKVDVVILDLMLPGDGGMKTLADLNRLPAPPRVLIYSATATMHSLKLAVAHGAFGYVEKGDRIEELRLALERVRSPGGGVHFSQGPSRLLTELVRTDHKLSGEAARLELELLGLLARGLTLKEAAFELHISHQKAYRIRQQLMANAKARNAQDLIRYAVEIGLAGIASRRAE